ncbi:Uncharacterised protein [uncultured archaeon]|nr:Uncharacterised protein [uncultured archaeon]
MWCLGYDNYQTGGNLIFHLDTTNNSIFVPIRRANAPKNYNSIASFLATSRDKN